MVVFLSLSDSILNRIRVILAGDIATHIALSQTCQRLHRAYCKDDNFWQFVCFKAGFGRPSRWRKLPDMGELDDHIKWRDLARLLVSHPSECEIKTCKEANACFANHYATSLRSHICDPLPSHSDDVQLHQLYFYLHFAHAPDGTADAQHLPDTFSILLTHLPTFPESKSSQYGPLCSHPNASCAFATFPPKQSLMFDNGNGEIYLSVQNPDGCTILDVNRALVEIIPPDMAQLQLALEHYRELQTHTGLSSHQFIENINRDRGFLGDHEYPFLQYLVTHA